MELITLKDTLDFLSASAPRPWLKRMILWMIFQAELDVYVRHGRIVPRVSLLNFYLQKFGELPDEQDREEMVRSKFEPEFADRILLMTYMDYVEDSPTEWSDDEEAHQIGSGYFLASVSTLGWYSSSLKGEVSAQESEVEHLFWDAGDHFGSNFRETNYYFSFEGLCLPREKIEMLQPGVELVTEKRESIEARVRPGRPRVWDWDGALLHLLNVAQRPDGLPVGPGAQAHVERLISEWFVDTTSNTPSPSQVRQHAARVMRAIGKPESR